MPAQGFRIPALARAPVLAGRGCRANNWKIKGNGNAHTYEEYIAVADLYKSGNMVVALIQAAAELKK